MRNVASVRTLFKFSQLVAHNIVLYTKSGMNLEVGVIGLKLNCFPLIRISKRVHSRECMFNFHSPLEKLPVVNHVLLSAQ